MLAPNEDDASIAVQGAKILAYLERVERLREERKAIDDDVADVFAEAKGNGFDVKTLKALLKERAADPDKLAEAEAILDTYRRAISRTRT